MRYLIFSLLLAFLWIGLDANPQFGTQVDLGLVEYDDIDEASGIIASRKNQNVLWTHNDSGDDNVIYALNTTGDHLGVYTIDGVTNRDWEDIAIAPAPGDNEYYIYLGDFGDNDFQYEDKYIYRFLEPEVSADQAPVEEIIYGADTITFKYPDGILYDAETLMAEPISGDLYVVTKRIAGNEDVIFRAEYPQSTTEPVILEQVATIDIPSFMSYGAVGGDISSTGLEIIIKTYSDVYYWSRKLEDELWEAFDDDPLVLPYIQEPQGEAICWKPGGMGYYTLSEENLNFPAHLYLYPRIDNFIALNHLPTALYKTSEVFTIIWSPSDMNCDLYYSSSPGGEDIENYNFSGISGTGSIASTPGTIGLGVGVYYCVIHNSEYGYTSLEFTLIVESSEAVTMLTPSNASQVTNSTPIFSWQANPGVPYYFLVLSDHPFTVGEDENGDPYVIGLQPIWQIITPNTFAVYGTLDPSGYFENSAPPLVPGVEYNWIVANNYGNDPLLTSKVISSPFSFQYSSDQTIESPELLYPENNMTIEADEIITFDWTDVEVAMTYHIFLYEVRYENDSEGFYPVWNQVTTNDQINFSASDILIDAEYAWKVFASDENDVSSMSEVFRFFYDTTIGTLNLQVRNIDGAPVGFATATLEPVDGSEDIVPLVVGANGNEIKIITPGEYLLTCSKAGYETADSLITIQEDLFPDTAEGDTFVQMVLDYSPSSFYGSIVDIDGFQIQNSTVYAEKENGEIRSVFSSNGNYSIGVTPGLWTITAEKNEYTLLEPIESSIIAGENIQLEDLVLSFNEKDVNGYVTNQFSVPIHRAVVRATNGLITRTEISNSSGFYTFRGLGFGNWTFNASKNGYAAPEPIEIEITPTSDDVIDLDDFVLTPFAALVLGNANNGLVGVEDVTIIADLGIGLPTITSTDSYGNYTLNLQAGNYSVSASLDGYSSQDLYDLEVSPGETLEEIDFFLLPEELSIFGTVSNLSSQPLENAVVTAILEGNADFRRETYSDTTNAQGQYFISPDYLGSYSVQATRENYYDSEIVNVVLDVAHTDVEQDLVLEQIPVYAGIHGSVLIYDETSGQNMPVDQAELTLRNQSGFEESVTIDSPDTLYEFNDLLVPDIFSLEITANYLDGNYYENIPQIEITQQDTVIRNFQFTYIENSVNLSGNVFILDEEQLPLFNAEMILKNSSGTPLDTTYTSMSGFFSFNNLTEDQYRIAIIAEYDNEVFTEEVSGIEWTGYDIVLDDIIIDYYLASIEFHITEDGEIPISNATVTISSEVMSDIVLISNTNGYCSANNVLHTGIYTISIEKQQGTIGRFIPAQPFEIQLDSLAYYSDHRQLPLQFDITQISESFSSDQNVDLELYKAQNYNSPAYFHYIDLNEEQVDFPMDNDENYCYATIPAPGNSGEIDFWFTSSSSEDEMYFSNENEHFTVDFHSEGIPDSLLSNITPNQPIFVFTQQAEFEVHIYDDSGQNLDELIDANGLVEWTLSSYLGELYEIPDAKRKVLFEATDLAGTDLEGNIQAQITLENTSITLQEVVQVKDMYLAELVITAGSDEINNEQSASFTVSAFSNTGSSMNIPVEFEPLSNLQGSLTLNQDVLLYSPGNSYIGQFYLDVRAFDPRTNDQVTASEKVTVYKRINFNSPADTLFTGEGCNLLLYSSMLDSTQTQQANLYLKSITTTPFKQYSVKSEICGKVFNLNSNNVQENFSILPGIAFEKSQSGSDTEILIAYWDNTQLEWIEQDIGFNEYPDMVELEHVSNIYGDYGQIVKSDPLGLYDLKLRPNPFTPYDRIGDNMGLQIEFRLSSNKTRYPQISARIYTVNGTLVRTISDNAPMLKGEYAAGETKTLYWDGRTDNGKMARNGRYLIQLIVEDAQNRKEILKTIVLIK